MKIKCTDLSIMGKGIFQYKGKTYEVNGLLPGEEAEVEIIKKGKWTNVKLIKVLTTSKDRAKPPCPYYEKCGGCHLQHMTVDAQNHFKTDVVKKLIGSENQVPPVLSMENPKHYRNKSHITFGEKKGGQVISGIYSENSHRLIEIDKCLINNPLADEIALTVKKLMKSFKMRPFDEDTGKGFLRHILVRTGYYTGDCMVVLVVASTMFKGKNNFVKALRKEHPEIKTIIMNVNNKSTSMVLGDREEVLFGTGKISDTLLEKRFNLSSKSFYQINPSQTERLYEKALDLANFAGNETVIDAYSGIGTIGIIAAKRVKSVIGVELNKTAVKDAIANAKYNNVKNIRFHTADAGEFMVKMASEGKTCDAVIMDPPRAGSDEKFLSSVVKLGPKKVIYISCNPETQARDIKYLLKHNYNVKAIQPVDLFPMTYHVENIVSLEKKT